MQREAIVQGILFALALVWSFIAMIVFPGRFPVPDTDFRDALWFRFRRLIVTAFLVFGPLMFRVDFFQLPRVWFGLVVGAEGSAKPDQGGIYDWGRFPLTPREKETAAFLLEGYTYREIAQKLSISPGTVKTHGLAVYKKNRRGKQNRVVEFLHEGKLGLLMLSHFFFHKIDDGKKFTYRPGVVGDRIAVQVLEKLEEVDQAESAELVAAEAGDA